MKKQNFDGTSKINIGRPAGLLRLGHIKKYNELTFSVEVELTGSSQTQEVIKNVQLPVSYYGIKGSFIGGYPDAGTPVIVAQGESNVWYIVSFLARDHSALNTTPIPNFPTLEKETVIIQSDDANKISISKKNGIKIGNRNNILEFDTKRFINNNTFDNIYSFSEASRSINGIIKRDIAPSKNFPSYLRLDSLQYDDSLIVVGMDPTSLNNYSNLGSSIKNPALTEKRELIYEFGQSYNILSDDEELNSYKNSDDNIIDTSIINRREGRADTLSLSLTYPNQLIENISGTVVDCFGNILDLNRNIIPIGKSDNFSINKIKTSLEEKSNDEFKNNYKNIKRLHRRGIAYHFELNSRKDISNTSSISGNININNTDDYTRQRSRFFIDVDKEGQTKINLSASSETGNIPLHTRYENYSTVNPNPATNDPKDLSFNDNYRDILIESFIGENAVIEIKDDIDGAKSSPIDRFSDEDDPQYIKHGMVYHNLNKICDTFKTSTPALEYIPTTSLGLGRITAIDSFVSKEIINYGSNANAGGRSLSMNLDGSAEINIGANTIDRQSLWLDLQGGSIISAGRDKNNNSFVVNTDGDFLVQIGGTTVSNDSRFKDLNNSHRPGALDIRVQNINSGEVSIFRIDNEGVSITTPARIIAYANQGIFIRSSSSINIEAEELRLNGRLVLKDDGAGSI